jgi:hypothetical protein
MAAQSGKTKKKSDVRVKKLQHLRSSGRVPPVPHQITRERKSRDDVNTGRTHSVVRVPRDALIERARSVCIGEHRVAFLDEGQRKEGGADLYK